MRNTEEKILAAARSLFEEKGFAATTTNEIAEAAGVSQVTLFRHFETKRNLFDRTVHSCFHPYKVEQYLKDDVTYDLGRDLRHIASTMMGTYKQNAPLIRMLMRDKMHESAPQLRFRRREDSVACAVRDYFSTMYRLGRLREPPELAMKFYFSNITGYFMREIFSHFPGKTEKKEGDAPDDPYFKWMIDKVITALEPSNTSNTSDTERT